MNLNIYNIISIFWILIFHTFLVYLQVMWILDSVLSVHDPLNNFSKVNPSLQNTSGLLYSKLKMKQTSQIQKYLI
jgi:hypothetical protein